MLRLSFPRVTANLRSRHKVGSILGTGLELLFINFKTIKKYSNPLIGQKMTSLNRAITVFEEEKINKNWPKDHTF